MNKIVDAQSYCQSPGTVSGSTCVTPFYLCSTSQNTCLLTGSGGSDYDYMKTTTDYTNSASKYTINTANNYVVDTVTSWSLCPYGSSLLLTSNSGYCSEGSGLKWFFSTSGQTNFITNNYFEGGSSSLYIDTSSPGAQAYISSSSVNQFTIVCPQYYTYQSSIGKCSGPINTWYNPTINGLSILYSINTPKGNAVLNNDIIFCQQFKSNSLTSNEQYATVSEGTVVENFGQTTGHIPIWYAYTIPSGDIGQILTQITCN
jgi:hypothetical protein